MEMASRMTPALAALHPVPVAPSVAEKLAGTKSSQDVFVLFETPRPDPAVLTTARRLLSNFHERGATCGLFSISSRFYAIMAPK